MNGKKKGCPMGTPFAVDDAGLEANRVGALIK